MQRFAFAALLMLSVGLIILGKLDSVLIERGRAVVVDLMAPVLDAVAQPIGSIKKGVAAVDSWFNLYAENQALHEENERLRAWASTARRLAVENAAYRDLLHVRSEPRARFVTTRIVAESGGPFARSVVVDAGADNGVRAGQIGLSGSGVVGRVLATGRRSARLLLLTDLNSRVPVALEGVGARGVLEGDNSSLPRLSYLPGVVRVHPGDRVVTSGIGGMFPPGLPIGAVEAVTNGVVRVRPWVRFETLDFVKIVDYDAEPDPVPDPQPPIGPPLPALNTPALNTSSGAVSGTSGAAPAANGDAGAQDGAGAQPPAPAAKPAPAAQ
ncbi:rod shape-determining protein MreC [Zavarzinia compransoris]|uniref:rod shape-determining protein MreC n=1 Tax=Zavarzinia marina TaxID=2911065 RepID=UPI001F177680|nr:rod shape-determining protein MreC [Zavarzinia marina]MCF4167480.1 rod shape-determining protein MreC [Zavarzinia marina]